MSFSTRMREGLTRQGFARNVAVLMAGTIGAHIITVAAVPIATRLYTPDEFSVLTVYSSILSILLASATLGLHIGIPIVDTHRRALSLLTVSGLVLMTGTALIGLIAWLAEPSIVSVLNRPDFGPYLSLLVPGFLLGGAYATLQMWFSRQKQFSLIARTRVGRSIGGTGTQLALGFVGAGPLGLVLGHLLYNGLGSFALLRKMILAERGVLRTIRRGDLAESLRMNRKYVYFTTPANLANVAAINIPVIAIASHPLAGEVGHLYLAQTVMTLPMMLIGSSVGQVFMAEAPEHHRDGTLMPFLLRVMRGLLLIGMPLLILGGIAGPFLAAPILGPEWEATGRLIAWMTPWMVFQLLSTPFSTIFYVVDRQVLAMLVQFLSLGVRCGAVMIALYSAPGVAMEVYALSGAAVYLGTLSIIVCIAKAHSRPA